MVREWPVVVARRTYSGEEIVAALQKWRFRRVDQTGSHVKLRYVHPETRERRTVIVPLHAELAKGTLKSIAEQAGAEDFQEFLDAIEALV